MSNGLHDGGMNPAGRSPDRIQQQIQDTRAHLDSTLDAIQQRLSPGMLVDELTHYLRDGGGNEFVHNFNEAVKRNPMPVTLMSVGLTWLMLSGREGRYAPDRADGGGRLREMAGTLGRMAFTGREKAATAADSFSQAGHDLRDRAGEAGADLREQAEQASSTMREQASRVTDSARHGAQQARSGFETALHEQPLLLGLAGIAIGAALGSLLPSTRPEDALMGDTRDRLADQAIDEADVQLRRGAQVVQSASQAASAAAEHEVERQRRQPADADQPRPPDSGQNARPAPDG